MKLLFKYAVILPLFFFASCELNIVNPSIPQSEIDELLKDCEEIPIEVFSLLSGIYSVSEGKSEFGAQAIMKASGKHLSFFFKKNSAFMIAQAGHIDSTIIIAGYWRYALGSETGLVSLRIEKENGAKEILQGELLQNLKIEGFYDFDGQKRLSFTYSKELRKSSFLIIGHRGGGRNIDRLPASENSVEMLLYAERLGCNGVEIDVRLTNDNVPVLFHDEYISKRLVKEDYFIGKISEYDYDVLRAYCTLKKGERIPTLKEALETIIYKTKLEFVWLDIKDANSLNIIAPIQKEYLEKAALAGRQLEIVIGLASLEIIEEYLRLPNFENYPSLCELEESYVERIGADIWAPRWSLGLLTERVSAMHKADKRVIIWTLDEPKFIETYIKQRIFDGILTNYPGILTYEYYSND